MNLEDLQVTTIFVMFREERDPTGCQDILSVSNCYTPAMRRNPPHLGNQQSKDG